MSDPLFVVGTPTWWTPAAIVAALFFAVVLWRRADKAALSGILLGAARVGIILLVVVVSVVMWANGRHGAEVFADHLVLTPGYSLENRAYSVKQIRYFDPAAMEVGEGIQSDFEDALTLGFDDGSEITFLARNENFERLRAWLVKNSIHERTPFERPSLRR